MTFVYRAKTMYHLMLVLLLLDRTNINTLYIDSKELFHLKNKLIQLGFFSKVYLVNNENENKLFRYFYTFTNAFFYQYFNWLYTKDRVICTSQHNIRGDFFKDFLRSKHVILLEDGYSSYKEFPDGIQNSLYPDLPKDSIFKFMLNGYFLNIYNKNIIRFIYTSPETLKSEIPRVYNKIKTRINKLSIISCIDKMPNEYKNNLKLLFFDKSNLNFNNDSSIVLLTQPLLEDGKCSKEEVLKVISLFDNFLLEYHKKGFEIFIKQHPRENNYLYTSLISKYCIKEIDKQFPFELLSLFNIEFDIGVTYYSTAVKSEIFKEKIILRNNLDVTKK